VIQFVTRTHPGRVRESNEDAVGVDEARRIWLVADGMGGHACGEVASAIVVDTILGAAELSLKDAVKAAHRAIIDAVARDSRCEGMGSTVVAVIARDHAAEIVWVGDSRAYLWRAGALSRVTRDHSVGELLREHNRLSEEEIRVHPQRDLVTQTLGHHEPHPGSVALDLRAGDTILLCSDGLHGELRDDEIAAVLKDAIALDETADRLVDGALAKGGRDNVSVILLTVPGDGSQDFWRRLRTTARPWLPALLGVTAALVGAMLVLWIGAKH